MRLTLLGTGDARQVPVYGCDCPACRNARADAGLRRRPCSALLECAGQRWLIDSGLVDLCERFRPIVSTASSRPITTPTTPRACCTCAGARVW